MGDWSLDLPRGFAYAASSWGMVDGNGNATVDGNHIIRINLATGAINTLILDLADPRSENGQGGYKPGRLIGTEGQIIGLDVDKNTGIIYFFTQPITANNSGGLFSYNPATDDLQELWNQPTPATYNTLKPFPTSNFTNIEVDEIGNRFFVTTNPSTDHENDGNATNEHDASIHMFPIGVAIPVEPNSRFAREYEPTALGAPQGMDIDYDPNLAVTTSNATYTESTNGPGSPAGTPITPFTNATITDPDQTMIYGATVAITNGLFAGDTLSGTGLSVSYNSTTGVLSFSGLATLAAYQTALNSVRFTNAGDNPTNYGNNQTRTLSITVFDGLTHSDVSTVNINVVGINDAPVNVVPAAQTVNEDTNLSITGLSTSDIDADPAGQQLTTTLSVANGTLTVLPAGGAAVPGSGTATVTLTGFASQINTTLSAPANIVYRGTQDYFGPDTLTFKTNDQGHTGTDPGLTGTATTEEDSDPIGITVNPVNDAPTLNTISNPAAILEDAGLQTVNLSGISEGPVNESSQTLTVVATSNTPGLIPNPTVSFNEGDSTRIVKLHAGRQCQRLRPYHRYDHRQWRHGEWRRK